MMSASMTAVAFEERERELNRQIENFLEKGRDYTQGFVDSRAGLSKVWAAFFNVRYQAALEALEEFNS
jgi:ribulose bisphosphate carboxylase small subunit